MKFSKIKDFRVILFIFCKIVFTVQQAAVVCYFITCHLFDRNNNILIFIKKNHLQYLFTNPKK